jgi:hypothetical protein
MTHMVSMPTLRLANCSSVVGAGAVWATAAYPHTKTMIAAIGMQACQLGLRRAIVLCNFLNLLTLVKKLAAGKFKDSRLACFDFFFPTVILITFTLFTASKLSNMRKTFQFYYKSLEIICSD